MFLVIDNYDSFVHNLARCLRLAGADTEIVRNDAIDAEGVRALNPKGIVIGPGPGDPNDAGCSLQVVSELQNELPILGVCLGLQVIGEVFGARVIRAPEALHGRTSHVTHDGLGIFEDLPNPLEVCRYHSLVLDANSLPEKFIATAHDESGVVMAARHVSLPITGVQFHPEAILTESGVGMLENWLGEL